MRRLCAQGPLVEEVAEYADGEDHNSEAVAGMARVAIGELSEGFVVVFWRCQMRRRL